jgi:hypothetical protein
MSEYRTGNHWGVTVVREGTQPIDASGHRPDAELVAVVTNGDRDLAERICALLNASDRSLVDSVATTGNPLCGWCVAEGYLCPVHAAPPADSCNDETECDCGHDGLDEMFHLTPCPIAVRRIARRNRPHPGPVGPGCVCDGSGRTCPRHGAVL